MTIKQKQQIAILNDSVLKALNLNIENRSPVYINNSNIEHIKSKHYNDYIKYGKDIGYIISNPHYVGNNKKDGSLEFVRYYKEYNEFVKVAVRTSNNNVFYARSLYVLNSKRVKNFINKRTLIKI